MANLQWLYITQSTVICVRVYVTVPNENCLVSTSCTATIHHRVVLLFSLQIHSYLYSMSRSPFFPDCSSSARILQNKRTLLAKMHL